MPDNLYSSPQPGRQRIALVLQGGGALGAYQAGVYQALHEHDLTPDWIVGTSIGAINGALIAGNMPDQRLARLRDFWDGVAHADLFNMHQVSDAIRRVNISIATLDTFVRGVPGFFSPRLCSLFPLNLPVDAESASFFDSSQLADTLAHLVDFAYLNTQDQTRLTVNAMHVQTGHLTSFDSAHQSLEVEHIMASGALPPGLPPVRIDGELYWDGALFSNTPLETVLDDEPHVDTLCFMVDLWSGEGLEPTTLEEVRTRQKDVGYASRSKMHIEDYQRVHRAARAARDLCNKLPAEFRSMPELQQLGAMAADTTLHLVRLVYGGRDWHMASKDLNFSRGSIEWRWQQGYQDASRSLEASPWNTASVGELGILVHDLEPGIPDQH